VGPPAEFVPRLVQVYDRTFGTGAVVGEAQNYRAASNWPEHSTGVRARLTAWTVDKIRAEGLTNDAS
jgi:hypothetical protein